MTLIEIIEKGGIAIWPLLFLSVLSLGTIIERVWFWSRILLKERIILDNLITAANRNWELVEELSGTYRTHPLGHFLFNALRVTNCEPEVFHLALEASADEELALMRRGDKVLEATIALSPLLGLLGTVLGLINSLRSIQVSDLVNSSTAGVTLGIGESLISTAVGLIVAIISLAFYRLFQAFWFARLRIFRKLAGDLEMVYRSRWFSANRNGSYKQSDRVENPNL